VVVSKLKENYEFEVSFPDANGTTLTMDEPAPLGRLAGPNASRVLAAAVANCLSASLLFCLRKSKIDIKALTAEAEPSLERNKEGYWRVSSLAVKIKAELPETEDTAKTSRCQDIFEKYCVVTGAIREGIRVDVQVEVKSTPSGQK
jgi:organic hydroperoxide reductase OsmC/OhrA